MKKINWSKNNNLIPAIIQDTSTNRILMLGYMNETSLKKTLQSKKVWFFSRSKNRLWLKGETSKNYLLLKEIYFDCDRDTILIKAKPTGPTCHLNLVSCFDAPQTKIKPTSADIGYWGELYQTIANRKKASPENSYTAKLFQGGTNKIIGKIMEETTEVIQASIKESKKRLISESVDLIYHLFVLLNKKNIQLEEVNQEIKKRRKNNRV